MKKIEQIIIGALLHDIGKFMQRAEIENRFEKDINEKSRVCPKDNFGNFFTHVHSLYTSAFFEDYKEYFPSVGDRFEKPEDNLANFASCHHNPRTEIGWIIAEADRLSSGMDRSEKDSDENIEDKNNFKKTRLKSIFSEITLDKKNNYAEKNFVYKIAKLENEDEIIPIIETEKKDLKEEYLSNWWGFIDEFKKLDTRNINVYIQSLAYILEKYTWCIPSSTIDLPDISLFDHSITTASIASVLYFYHEKNNSLIESEIKNKNIEKFQLISGDLSGIQKYIYNISGTGLSGSSKILRARSYYIELLNEISSRFIIDSLGLSSINLLYCSGGKFIILSPNLENISLALEQTITDISEWYLHKFNGELSLNIATQKLSGADFKVNKFAEKFRELSQKIEVKKKNKFSEVFLKDFNINNFVLSKDYNNYKFGSCRFCGKEPANQNQESLQDEDKSLGGFCLELKGLGEKLPSVNTIAFSYCKLEKDKSILKPLSFFNEKYFVYFFKEMNLSDINNYFSIFSLNTNSSYPLKLVANYIPKDKVSNLSFEDISKESCQNSRPLFINIDVKDESEEDIENIDKNGYGQKMLGVLRADVDHMGFIFSYGLDSGDLKKSNLTISRYYTMSRMFNIFFAVFLKNMINKNVRFNPIYTVYAGGDDLFLIGPWDTIIDFAIFIQEKFSNFTCLNDNITISAAIGLFKPSFPVKRFAFSTGELLEKAKKSSDKSHFNKNESDHGNKISLFNKVVDWKEAKNLLKEGVFLENEVKKNKFNGKSKINSSFLYRLLIYQKMHNIFKEDGDIKMLKYLPLLSYDIGRNIVEKHDDKGEILNKDLVHKIAELTKDDNMDNLIIPISWAVYKNRKN